MKALWPTLFGAVMVVAAASFADTAQALTAAAASLVAVVLSVWWRPAATGAVLLAAGTALLGAPAPMYTALAGLAAAAFLVLRHNEGRAPAPAMVAAVAFAAAAALVAAMPLEVPWLPLIAPLALFVGFVVALSPYLRQRNPR